MKNHDRIDFHKGKIMCSVKRKKSKCRRYGDVCIWIADSLCYKAETNTPL